ncbi:hypothetical protein Dimus_028711 [Dionaea muscipula]
MAEETHGWKGDIDKGRSNNINGDNDDDDDQQGMGAKFNCSFCKRGFTNPQALGGHMNLHRKDKHKHKHKYKHKPKLISEPYPGNMIVDPSHVFFPSSTTIFVRATTASSNYNYNSSVAAAKPTHSHYGLEIPSCHGEELDLELRLGHRKPPTD